MCRGWFLLPAFFIGKTLYIVGYQLTMRANPYCLALLLSLFISPSLFSQASTNDPKDIKIRTVRLSGLYNGPEYKPDELLYNNGSPFFYPDWTKGSVDYNGTNYKGVELMYDALKDQVLLKHFDGSSRIQLVKEKVDSFSLGDKSFLNLHLVNAKTLGLEAGFYEKLYDGNLVLLKKYKKNTQLNTQSGTAVYDVFTKYSYYLLDGSGVKSISGKKDFLKLIGASGKVESALRERKLNYRKQKDEYMITALNLIHQMQ